MSSSEPGTTRILFVRHGEVHNPDRIFYGRLPRFPLSAEGRRQAETTAARLAGCPLAAIYTSPLLRARQTAAILRRADPRVPIAVTRSLLEIRSARQGQPIDVLEALGWNFYEPPFGEDDETIPAIFARVRRFARRVVARHPGATVAAVTHADIVRIARAGFTGRPLVLASIRDGWYPAKGSVLAVTLTPNLRAAAVEGVES
jgi:broad specificity phosphatase PhoE